MTLKRILANVVYWAGRALTVLFWLVVAGALALAVILVVDSWESALITSVTVVAFALLWLALIFYDWANDVRREP